MRETTCIVAGLAYNMGIHGISCGSIESGNPVSSDLAGFRFLVLLIITFRSHAAKRLGLLLLAIDLAVQPAICGSRNDTDDFLGGLAVGIHFFLLRLLI